MADPRATDPGQQIIERELQEKIHAAINYYRRRNGRQ